MREIKLRTSHRPRPLPAGRWAMTQRWNDLLFAHWRAQASQVAALLPDGFMVDTFDGSAWLGVVPFWMDRIKVRGVPTIPGARSFPELNLRTYVRDHAHRHARRLLLLARRRQPAGGRRGAQLLSPALLLGRDAHPGAHSEREFSFLSRGVSSAKPVIFKARYRGLGPTTQISPKPAAGSLEYFLTERYCLFTHNSARPACPRQRAPCSLAARRSRPPRSSATICPAPSASTSRHQDPVLHYSRRLAVYMWPPELAAPARAPPAHSRPGPALGLGAFSGSVDPLQSL